jgi:hypothetical protein
MNNDEIVADFRRRYEGAFVQVLAEDKGVKTIGKMQRVRADPERFATLEIATSEYGLIQMNMGSDEYQIKFNFPQAGTFQCGIDAFIFERKAEKQYQRGLSSGNGRFTSVTAGLVGNVASMSLDAVKAAFDHKQYNLKAALAMLKGGTYRSVALVDNFAITLPMTTGGSYFIWHRGTLVAGVDADGGVTKMYEPVFGKAITELIHGNQ